MLSVWPRAGLEDRVKTSLAVVTTCVALTAVACSQPGSAPDLSTPEARGSYAQGVSIGEGGKGLPLDVDAFLAGVRAGLEDSSTLNPQERQQALMEFRSIVMEAMNASAAESLAEGQAFLTENGQRDGVSTTTSGLQYEVIRAGDGARPTAEDTVVINYRGQTIDGTVFDDSYADGTPVTYMVGNFIPGFAEGLQLMPVGSHYKFFIPGSIAYGMNPPPGGQIGPNDTLIFEVELLRIEG